MSTAFEAVVQPEGRILIPSALRKSLGILPGSHVLLRQQGDSVLLTPRDVVKEHLRTLFADVPGSMANELIAEHRDEADQERSH